MPILKPIDSFSGEYFFLSNFYLCQIEYKGLVYPSTENAYQAAKNLDTSKHILFTDISPAKSKSLSRTLPYDDKWWTSVKVDIMRELLYIKFSDKTLEDLLLKTEDAQLIEGNTWHDTFWGVCDGKGQNHLGKLLMEVRDTKLNDKLFGEVGL